MIIIMRKNRNNPNSHRGGGTKTRTVLLTKVGTEAKHETLARISEYFCPTLSLVVPGTESLQSHGE